MGQPGKILAPWPKTKGIEIRTEKFALEGCLKITVQDSSIDDDSVFRFASGSRLFGTDSEVGKTVETTFVGSIEDLPIDQPAIAR